jgi:hypothetical protein
VVAVAVVAVMIQIKIRIHTKIHLSWLRVKSICVLLCTRTQRHPATLGTGDTLRHPATHGDTRSGDIRGHPATPGLETPGDNLPGDTRQHPATTCPATPGNTRRHPATADASGRVCYLIAYFMALFRGALSIMCLQLLFPALQSSVRRRSTGKRREAGSREKEIDPRP